MTDTTEQQAVTVAQEDISIGEAVYRDFLMGDLDHEHGEYEGERCAIEAAARVRLASVSSASAEGWVPERFTLSERELDDECGCPEETWDTPFGTLNMHLTAGKPSNACLDNGDEGEWSIDLTRATVDDARTAFFAWSMIAASLPTASPEPVPATNQAGEVDVRARLQAKIRAGHCLDDSEDGDVNFCGECDWCLHILADRAIATQPATSQEGEEVTLIDTKLEKLCPSPAEAMRAEWSDLADHLGHEAAALPVDDAPEYTDLITGKPLEPWAQQVMDEHDRLAATPTPPTLSEDLRALGQAIGAEIERQCSIGAGKCGTAPDGSGLFEVDASLDLNGFAQAIARAALAQVKAS